MTIRTLTIDELNHYQADPRELALVWPYNDPSHNNYYWLQNVLNVSPEAIERHVDIFDARTLANVYSKQKANGDIGYVDTLLDHYAMYSNEDPQPTVVLEVTVNHMLLNELTTIPEHFTLVVRGDFIAKQLGFLGHVINRDDASLPASLHHLAHGTITGYLQHLAGITLVYKRGDITFKVIGHSK